MDSTIYGSPKRDRFKQHHKRLSKEFYACDLDFVLVTKTPMPDVVAVLDYKANDAERVTFAEVIAYCALLRRGIPVYVVRGDVDLGAFEIERFMGGHHREPRAQFKPVARVLNWEQFGDWERRLRDDSEATWEP
jgi:hypothetical protein